MYSDGSTDNRPRQFIQFFFLYNQVSVFSVCSVVRIRKFGHATALQGATTLRTAPLLLRLAARCRAEKSSQAYLQTG